MTRRERRARRHRRFVTDKEARLAARLARLDYKTSGETGTLKPPTKGRIWYLGNRKNGHAPPPGQAWERSGPTYVTANELGTLAEPVLHHRWRSLMADI